MIHIVEKMLKDKPFEMDVVVTFIRGEYRKPMKRASEESEETNTVKLIKIKTKVANVSISARFKICSSN